MFALLAACCAPAAHAEVASQRLGTPPLPVPAASTPARGSKPKPLALPPPPSCMVPKCGVAPEIDGKLDDAAWAQAARIVLERRPDGTHAGPPTEVRLLRDDQNLYAALRCSEPAMNGLRTKEREADGAVYQDDSIEMFLGVSGGDYFHFGINASGSRYDARRKAASWNSGFKTAVAKGEREWIVELAAPLEPMFGKAAPDEWIANFARNRYAGGEAQEIVWSPTGGDSHLPERFGKFVFGAAAAAEQPAATADAGNEKTALKVLRAEGGEGVVCFDLAALPAKARVYRAGLLLFRTGALAANDSLADVEVCPLFAEFKGGQPAGAGKALELRAPWFTRFDATEAVRQWVEGKPNGGFFVKTCPKWNAEGSCLEVLYEGKAANAPPQVKDVSVLHRAGQTFITWKEVDPAIATPRTTWSELQRKLADPNACRYRIYAHDKPIDASNIGEAEWLAESGPLSAYNLPGCNIEGLPVQAVLPLDHEGPVPENYVYKWQEKVVRRADYPVARFSIDEKAGMLPPGTGLYVHQPAAAGKRYYAVVSCKAGIENTADITAANAPAAPADETAGPGEPVLQGDGLLGAYPAVPGKRTVYVQWCAPPLAPRPNMYFNWSVLLPTSGPALRPVEIYFHPRVENHLRPDTKLLDQSIQIVTKDMPYSGWHGYNDAADTLKSFKSGRVGNHTQKRIVSFLDWAKRKFPIDPEQIIATGSDGAAAMALSQPELFAYVWIMGFDGLGAQNRDDELAAIWGPRSPLVRDDTGRADWKWASLDERLPARGAKDLPLFLCCGGSWGREGNSYGKGRFYSAMLSASQPLAAGWGWDGGTILSKPGKVDGLWRGVLLTRTTPVLAIAHSTLDTDQEPLGHTGGARYQWSDLKDGADLFQVTLGPPPGKYGPIASTFDLAARRLRNFKLKPGEKVKWEARFTAAKGDAPPPSSGEAQADDTGLLKIAGLVAPSGAATMTIAVTRAK